MSTFAVIIEQAEEGGFGAWCPDLPGCIALGDTVDEAIERMREAVTEQLTELREAGLEVPSPKTVTVATVDAA